MESSRQVEREEDGIAIVHGNVLSRFYLNMYVYLVEEVVKFFQDSNRFVA
jgi:hypothetical protein